MTQRDVRFGKFLVNACYLQKYNAPVIRYVYVQKSSRYVKSVATSRSVLLSVFLEVIFEEV